ncbi:GGDEF domain-containing protein [Gorillibacterium sp. sgz5001074]|uniref:GGDEF domain-containing protein n=1 Tax=Gorillibacterium sp. sgz5001074 TaxID=3446695 RepID=UPI003F67F3FB
MRRIWSKLFGLRPATAIFDRATGTYNRHYAEKIFPELADEARRSGKQLTILLIDFRGFHRWKERFGRAKGNMILSRFVKELQWGLQQEDRVCRLSGYDFILLLPDVGADRVPEYCHHIFQAIKRLPVDIEWSCAAIHCPPDSRSLPELLEEAYGRLALPPLHRDDPR